MLLAACAAPLVAPSTAAAVDGQRWPGRTITYYDATRDKLAVRRAVHAWNVSGVRIRFVRVFNRSRANIVLRNSRAVPSGCGTGRATLGYLGRGRQGFVNILHGYAKDGQGCAWPGQTFVVAHELGHVLGLGHDDRACSIMNSSHTNGVAGSRCVLGDRIYDHEAQWRCRIIEPRDVRRAIRKYGGRYRIPRRNPWCNLVPRSAPPTPMAATIEPTWGSIAVTFRQPQPRWIPPYLRSRAGTPAYDMYRTPGTCLSARPADGSEPRPVATYAYNGQPGEDETYTDTRPEPGSWCWAVWALDAFDRPSLTPATSVLEVPPTDAALRSRAGAGPKLAGRATADRTRPPVRTFSLQDDAR